MKKETQIGIRIDSDLVDRVKRQAENEHRTLSQVVRMLLEGWLKKASKRVAA